MEGKEVIAGTAGADSSIVLEKDIEKRLEFYESVEHGFRGELYILYASVISAGDQKLIVEVEKKETGERWSGDFSVRCAFRYCLSLYILITLHLFMYNRKLRN